MSNVLYVASYLRRSCWRMPNWPKCWPCSPHVAAHHWMLWRADRCAEVPVTKSAHRSTRRTLPRLSCRTPSIWGDRTGCVASQRDLQTSSSSADVTWLGTTSRSAYHIASDGMTASRIADMRTEQVWTSARIHWRNWEKLRKYQSI